MWQWNIYTLFCHSGEILLLTTAILQQEISIDIWVCSQKFCVPKENIQQYASYCLLSYKPIGFWLLRNAGWMEYYLPRQRKNMKVEDLGRLGVGRRYIFLTLNMLSTVFVVFASTSGHSCSNFLKDKNYLNLLKNPEF